MKRWWGLYCLACLVLLYVQAPAVSQAQEEADTPVVIVSPQQTPSSISKNALRAIFGMRLRNWPADQTPVRVFVLRDDSSTHSAFTKQVLNIYPHQLRLAWDRLVFSGTGQAPTEVASEAEMREKVANTPGAIGYLRRSMVDDNIHVLQIQ
jgi:ABC-type phosphate transport system substrate-binding protein